MSGRLLKRWGGALALIAYSFQLLISIGHVHADEVFGALGHAIELGSASVHVAAKADDWPGGASHLADTSDTCQICAVVHAAANGVQPPIQSPALLRVADVAALSRSRELWLTRPSYLFSHTRAPPALSA